MNEIVKHRLYKESDIRKVFESHEAKSTLEPLIIRHILHEIDIELDIYDFM